MAISMIPCSSTAGQGGLTVLYQLYMVTRSKFQPISPSDHIFTSEIWWSVSWSSQLPFLTHFHWKMSTGELCFEWQWPQRPKYLVSRWWNYMGRIRGCGLGGDVSLGRLWGFESVLPSPVYSLLPVCGSGWVCSCCPDATPAYCHAPWHDGDRILSLRNYKP